ncbi:MAG: hypothetical protein JW804_05685 [Sedimentisphaerales bacterium]|nr:hypothetical protein [Sedimentisphaerales bacterium]
MMTLAGLLLIVAAVLKAHQILTEPVISKGFWESWLFFVIQIPLELGLGIWLVSGLFKKPGWLLVTIAFAGFIAVTMYKAITGQESCGCFGRIVVDPQITLFAMDVPLFLLLVIFRPMGETFFPPPWPDPLHFIVVAVPTAFILGALIPILVFNKPPDKTEKYVVIKPDKWQTQLVKPKDPPGNNEAPVIINPQIDSNYITIPPAEINETDTDSIGELVPIDIDINEDDIPEWQLMLKHTDIAGELNKDVKIILFYHYDCPDCAVAIPLYSLYSREYAADETIQFAFIEGPPYGPDEEKPIPADTTALVGKLDLSRDWIFESPLILLLNNGSLVQWWQVEYPEIDELLQTVLSAQ